MSCYHPNFMRFEGQYNEGKKVWRFCGKATDILRNDVHNPTIRLVPCGHCIGCRMDYARTWSNRMLMEYDHHQTAVFLTLTYDNDHITIGMVDDDRVWYSLYPPDLQNFLKRLRQRFPDRQLRFYASGEYGSLAHTYRPHYHLIVFGLNISDFDLIPWDVNELGQPSYRSAILESVWKAGICTVSEASYQTFNYVSRYTMKKRYKADPGENSDWYGEHNILKEFTRCSLKPGIGMLYFEDHPDFDLTQNLQFSFGGDSYIFPVPTKLVDKFVDNPDDLAIIKDKRRHYAIEQVDLKLMNTDLTWSQFLTLEEQAHRDRLKKLKERY